MQKLSYLKFERNEEIPFLSLFLECDELYFIEPAGNDWKFGYVSRRSASAVTVTVGEDALLSGEDVLQALHIAMATKCEAEPLAKALANAGLPEKPLKRALWMKPRTPESSAMAYRTFLSTRDLERLLAFPVQQSTAAFRRVLLVDATVVPLSESGLVAPDEQLDRKFMTVYPEGVTVAPRGPVELGDPITVTYSAPGYESAVHKVAAGKPSPFVSYYGAAMCIQPLSRLGMELKPISHQKEPESDDKSKGRSVTIVLRFTDDRTLRSDVTLDPASSEYSLLRAGTWHGYRARRMVVRNHGDEAYLIDMRINENDGQQSVSHHATPQSTATQDADLHLRTRGTSPWMYVCAALLAIILGIVVINYLPSMMPGSNPDYAPGTVDTENAVNAEKELMGIEPVKTDAVADTAVNEDTVVVQPESVAQPEPGISAEDAAYLDKNTVWRRSALKSKAAIDLYDSFSKANLKAIASNPYLSDRKCANQTAVKVVTLIWQANGADTQESNQKVLRQLAGADKIDLHDLHEKLARVRPTNPNRSERP